MFNQSNTLYLTFAIFAMAGVTLLIRVMPIILPKTLLDSPILLAVNKGLPLSVMTLLILTSLQWQTNTSFMLSPLLIAQILALIVVLISYHFWKHLLVSMVIGIASLNGFLWMLQRLG